MTARPSLWASLFRKGTSSATRSARRRMSVSVLQLEDQTTPAGVVKDIAAATASSAPASLTAVGNTLFFTADDGTNGNELWKSDGTSCETQLVKDIRPGSTGSGSADLAVAGTGLFFTANDAVHGRELWVSADGTAANTYMVTDLYAGATGSAPADLTLMGSYLYFSADDPTGGRELWRTDGTVTVRRGHAVGAGGVRP